MAVFFGKYRGKVAANRDPKQLGRIQVSVPAVLGDGQQSWAMPCVPYAGKNIGWFAIPPIGSNIWVEFEGGDPDYPIWSGCFWGQNELPAAAKIPEPADIQVFQAEGMSIALSNFANTKGVTIELKSPTVNQPLKLEMNDQGIALSNSDKVILKLTADSIELTATNKIDLKNGSSTVSIANNTIQLKESSVELNLTASDIEAKSGGATAKIASSGIELNSAPASAKLSASGVELGCSAAIAKVAPASVELSNGAASVKLSPASVNINNGALEVI